MIEITDPAVAKSGLPARIMLFDHTAQLGGGEIALLEMVRHFDRRRITPIVVIASKGPLVERMYPIAETHVLELDGDVLHARKDDLGSGVLSQLKKVAESLAYIWRLAAFIRANQIDLVHTNSLKADILGGIAARLTGKKLVWHVRDRIEDDYLPRSVVFGFRRLSRILPHFVIGNSIATLRTLHLQGHVPSAAVASGVDMSTFVKPSDTTQPPKSEIDMGIIGRLCEWKGQHIFLTAAKTITDEFPRVRFKIIGAPLFGEEGYEEELRTQCHSLGLDNVVDFMGFRHDVRELIQRLDVVVHASTTGEPLGQVILQGMAAGKPVIATNGGGVPEIMLDGQTGILVPMGDANALASAMRTILSSADLGRQFGRNGHRHVMERFTIESTTGNIESIYAGLLPHKFRDATS